MHGAGNDFVLIDGRTRRFRPSAAQISAICDRHFGVGGDQLLVLEPGEEAADLRLRIYNIDGQEAETCLNATRCAAWIILNETGASSVRIATMGGLIKASAAAPMQVTLRQPEPRFEWQSVPLAEPRDTLNLGLQAGPLTAQGALSMGNPHLTCFVPDLDAIDVPRWADQLQKHPLLPQGANVGVAQILSPEAMRLVVWERPGILTQACGSGACAAFTVARRLGLITADRAEVAMPGGKLFVEETPEGALLLTGPVAVAFWGQLP
ncbi:diaminopimelate epimerase [Xinfangfangia sp. CPCC 101601]|uniref:Diaminopimelate epimerase n=1 Tax=Pseudogemmobacter lacusdianii TaxID=3069608 RepID=A0ABU0VXH9_9RHOB|nr:diaminopimelate epimerase [Xinfangfangia sp. CPCC 101601]MDQ2065905.1 diaminopimelate epimerase [Xinfangfangia sp. CPCC 101601]